MSINEMPVTSDYMTYRGKCKELAEQAVRDNPVLVLVRGYYHCPLWGKQAHWWCKSLDGTVVDLSVRQFPTKGAGAEYEEFDGSVECEYCSKSVPEDKLYRVDQHAYCSYECYGHDVGF